MDESRDITSETFHPSDGTPGSYSQNDILELLENDDERCRKVRPKDCNPDAGMTQNMLDEIFEPGESRGQR